MRVTSGWWKRLAVVLLLGWLVATPVLLISTQAAEPKLNGAHWARKSTPFTLRVGDNVSAGWQKIVKKAINNWNEFDIVKFRLVGGQGGANCRVNEGRVEICDGAYGNNGWLGLSSILLTRNGDHIVGASVQLNNTYFRSGRYSSRAAKLHTACHELGHTIGLDHANYDSCMNDSQRSVFRDETPSIKDKRALNRYYDHRDSRSTVSGAALTGSFYDPGTIVAGERSGGEIGTSSSIYRRSVGPDLEMVTIITWVNDGSGR